MQSTPQTPRTERFRANLRARIQAALSRDASDSIREHYKFLRGERAIIETLGDIPCIASASSDDAVRIVLNEPVCSGVYVHHNLASATAFERLTSTLSPQVSRASRSGKAPTTVGNEDIVALRVLPFDIDSTRSSGSGKDSASKEEVERSFETAKAVYLLLADVLGTDDALAVLFSGNGWWVLVALDDIPVNCEQLVRRAASAAKRLFERAGVCTMDTSVVEPRQIQPLAGTWKRKKADAAAGRVHRRTWIAVPETVRPIGESELRSLVENLEERARAYPELVEPVQVNTGRSNRRSTRKATTTRHAADDIPIADVLAFLGLNDGGRLVCPVCGGDDPDEIKIDSSRNRVHCFRGKCSGPRDWGAIDLVKRVRLHADPDDKARFAEAVNLLAERFGTPRAEGRRGRGHLRVVESDRGMVVDGDTEQLGGEQSGRSPHLSSSEPTGAAAIGQSALVVPTQACEPGAFKLTDLGNAERFVRLHGPNVRWCAPWGKWVVWDGQRWAPDEREVVDHLAQLTVRSIYTEANNEQDDDRRQAIAGHAIRSESAARKAALLEHAKSLPGIPVSPNEFDQDPWSFNCPNGTIDLRTGELRQHRREDLITKMSPVKFVPDAACPTYERFLAGSLPDPEVRECHLRLRGYGLTGSVDEHVFPVHCGEGGNGKGTQERLDLYVLGDYGRKIPSELLMARRGEAHPTERATLFGVRHAFASETEENRSLNIALVKELTGGDEISCRRMREDFWTFKPTHKLCLSTNHKPLIRETKDAIWRRVLLFNWSVVIPEKERDKKLDAKLKKEAEGYLALLVRKCLVWQREGLAVPESIRAASASYREENDVLGRFLNDVCETGSDFEGSATSLYTAYKAWAEENGEPVVSQTRFGVMLEDRGFTRARCSKTGRVARKGLRVRGTTAAGGPSSQDADTWVDQVVEDALRDLDLTETAAEQYEQSEGQSGIAGQFNLRESSMPELTSDCSDCSAQESAAAESLRIAESSAAVAEQLSEPTRIETRVITGVTRYAHDHVLLWWDGPGSLRFREVEGPAAVGLFVELEFAPVGWMRREPHKSVRPVLVRLTLDGVRVRNVEPAEATA